MSSSANNNSDNDSRIGRQPAKRAFADEFANATKVFRESDGERAPKFAVLPTGERANRVFAVGTLTEAEDISKSADSEYWQARVVDPTGTFYVYAGQYQPEAMAALRSIEAPAYVMVVGKPGRTRRTTGTCWCRSPPNRSQLSTNRPAASGWSRRPSRRSTARYYGGRPDG